MLWARQRPLERREQRGEPLSHSQAMPELERFVRAPAVHLALARERDRMVRAARDLAELELVPRLEA